jgi:hypothetical protein
MRSASACEIEILLHQQNRHFVLLTQREYHAPDILDDGRLDALGRRAEQQQLQLRHQGARGGQLLLLTA